MQAGHTDTPGSRLLSGPPAYRPATPWQPAPAVLVTACIIAAGLAAMALVILLSAGADAPGGGSGLWALAAMQAIAVALTLRAGRAFGGRISDVLMLRPPRGGWRAYAGALLAMAILQVALVGVQHFVLGHDLLTDLRPVIPMVTGAHWPLAAVVMAVGAPLSEELLFRGFLLGALAQARLGFAGAALVSTAAWTALHPSYSPLGLADVFANGLLFCWLLWRTGSLRVPLLCHAVYNGLIVLALILAVKWPA